jgi:hypothetical protein
MFEEYSFQVIVTILLASLSSFYIIIIIIIMRQSLRIERHEEEVGCAGFGTWFQTRRENRVLKFFVVILRASNQILE